jgi:hypothetical protein
VVTSSIKRGDVVLAQKNGVEFFALVKGTQKGKVQLKPLSRQVTWHEVGSRGILAHWRRSKQSQVDPLERGLER